MAFTSNPRTNGSGWSLYSPLVRLADHVHTQWRHRQTERILQALPAEIRKDIGWPTTDGPGNEHRNVH